MKTRWEANSLKLSFRESENDEQLVWEGHSGVKRNYLDLRTKLDLPSKASRLGTFGILENTEFTVKATKDRVFYNVVDGCSRIWILDMIIYVPKIPSRSPSSPQDHPHLAPHDPKMVDMTAPGGSSRQPSTFINSQVFGRSALSSNSIFRYYANNNANVWQQINFATKTQTYDNKIHLAAKHIYKKNIRPVSSSPMANIYIEHICSIFLAKENFNNAI